MEWVRETLQAVNNDEQQVHQKFVPSRKTMVDIKKAWPSRSTLPVQLKLIFGWFKELASEFPGQGADQK
jgi:hypothetical protein